MQLLVNDGYVRGWDDPRLPTLAGMRRRGITPDAINMLCHEIGITRSDNEIALHKLFYHVRQHLDETSPRALAVLRPLRLVRSWNTLHLRGKLKKKLAFGGRCTLQGRARALWRGCSCCAWRVHLLCCCILNPASLDVIS